MLMQMRPRPKRPDVSVVQRYIREHNLKPKVDTKPRKAFEVAKFGELWQTDTMYDFKITEQGQKEAKTVYLIRIIDDHTRVIVASEYFYSESIDNYLKVLYKAIEKYGVPQTVYCDNGSVYKSPIVKYICGKLGTQVRHTKVKDPQAKGKVERSFRTSQTQFSNRIDPSDIHSLEELNGLYQNYVAKYHNTKHRGLNGQTPLERLEESESAVTPMP